MQIFEAEQDNLYFEHITAGKVLVSAVRKVLTTDSHADMSFVEAAAAHCSRASELLQALVAGGRGQDTYQPALFRYFYLFLHLAGALDGQAHTKAKLAEVCGNASGVHPWIVAEVQAK